MIYEYNWIAVLISVVASMIIGYLWYSPMLFAKAFMAALGKTQEEIKQGQGSSMGFMVVFAIIGALAIATFVSLTFAEDAMSGAMIGFFLWLGIAVPVLSTTVIFEGRSMKLHWLNLGYQLVSFVVQGAILGAMRP